MSREHDRKLEQALKHELRQAGTPDRDGCVDAETLAAWADGGLDAAQMASVEMHVSSCARCQAIVGMAARSAPVVAPAVPESPFRFPRWALAPLAAAAAIVIWMIVPQDRMQAPPAPAREAEIKEQANAPVDQREPAPPAAPETRSEAKRERGLDAPALQDRQQRAEERAPAAVGAVAAAPPSASQATAPAADAMLQRSARLAPAPLEIVSPDPSSRWRVVNRAIERSTDGGGSWAPILAPGGESFTAGVSPARSVCWLIGSNGLVMVTVDGVAFARVPLPERIDLTAITAADARSATVTSADGRTFRTDDSGRTWRQF